MNEELIVGLLALAVPLLGGGYFALRNNTGIFRMFVAMTLLALGYLTVTGALNDIGATILGRLRSWHLLRKQLLRLLQRSLLHQLQRRR